MSVETNRPDPFNVLFVVHEASRTGAPIMLLNLMRFFKSNNSLSFQILLKKHGPLAKSFLFLAPTKVLSLRGWRRKLFKWVGLSSLIQKMKLEMCDYEQNNIDFVYCNTIANGDILKSLDKLSVPIVTHVHELENVISAYGKSNWLNVAKYSDHYIAASNAVKENLVRNRGVDRNLIDVVHECVPAFPRLSLSECRADIRKQLGVSLDAFVVCGSGLCSQRKGIDLFVQLAQLVKNKDINVDIYFLWVGGWQTFAKNRAFVDSFIKEHSLSERVLITGEVSNPLEYYAAADVFALVSREDPFPLVCLEAASVGKPVLCFDGAGGMPEFVGEDAGYVVPYLDVGAMADRIVDLSCSPEKLSELGKCAQRKVQEKYDTSVIAKHILRVIDKVKKN